MAYEFTQQKIAAERKARIKRVVVCGLLGGAGLALGIATNDMHDLFGIFAASALATLSGLAGYYAMA